MKKSKFIKSSIILIIGGMLVKVIGLFTKIILTRKIGIDLSGMYSLILPTYLLLISISNLALPSALNVLISSNKYNNKNLIIYAMFISLTLDLIIILFMLFLSKFLAINLLNNSILIYPLIATSLTLPFITISNILRSYYFAKERIIPHVISNVLEDLIKLILIILFIDKMLNNKVMTLSFIVLINILSELSSIIIFLSLLKNFSITKKDLKFNIYNIKALLKIAIPQVISRLIGSITYFLEPIILTYVLINKGFNNHYINYNYGLINSYILPLILIPSFLTNAISQALIPVVSKNYVNNNIKYVKYKIKQALLISLFIGLLATSIYLIYGKYLLNFIYNINDGLIFIKILAPIFLFHYIEHILLNSLIAINKAKINMFISLINMFIRTIILFIFLKLDFKIYALIISISLNILFTSIYSAYKLNKYLK